MIKRNLYEEYILKYQKLVEDYDEVYPKKDNVFAIYNCLFEDLKSIREVYIDARSYFDGNMHPSMIYDELLFNNGEKHYFVIEEFNNKLSIKEYDLSNVLEEYFDYEL